VGEDISTKMRKTTKKLKDTAGDDYIRFEGCPVSVAEHVLFLVELGGTENPYKNKESAWQFARHYLTWKGVTAAKRMVGEPYQKGGPCRRGEAEPDVSVPPPPAE
jgi:hypothetical protein